MSYFEITEKSSTKKQTSFTAIASTNKVDRHGEVVEPAGWDYKEYEKNPIILWAHNHSIPAIGKATKIWMDGSGERAKLMFKGVLHGIGEMGQVAKALVDEGIINSFSVGFKALDYEDNTFTKQELLEISLVNVPANSDAQITAYKALQKAGVDENAMNEVGVNAQVIEMQERMFNMEQQIKTLVKASKGVNPTQIREQKVALSKVIARATDKMLEDKTPSQKRELAKVAKSANEKLTKLLKEY